MSDTPSITLYPGLSYPPDQIVKFKESVDFFSLLLTNEEVIHFSPEQPDNFRAWLLENGVKMLEV